MNINLIGGPLAGKRIKFADLNDAPKIYPAHIAKEPLSTVYDDFHKCNTTTYEVVLYYQRIRVFYKLAIVNKYTINTVSKFGYGKKVKGWRYPLEEFMAVDLELDNRYDLNASGVIVDYLYYADKPETWMLKNGN